MNSVMSSAQFSERLGMTAPIVLAPMGGGPSTPELIAAVANRGGLGSIAAGYLAPDDLAEVMSQTRALTSGPVAINIFVPPDRPLNSALGPDARAVLNQISDQLGAPVPEPSFPNPATFHAHVDFASTADLELVSFTFGLPPESVIDQLRAAGKVVAGTANTYSEAVRVAEAGCDVVILQGFEAGAHRGGLSEVGDSHVGLFALLEQARNLDVPVIASGGITSGAGVAACLALGAVAAQIGTAFLVTDESGATPEWKKAVTASVDADTTITRAITGRGARGVRNQLIEDLGELDPGQLADYPIMNGYTAGLRKQAKALGEPQFQSLWTGQAGSAARTGPAGDVFDHLVAELAATIKMLSS
jgi:nitronate monooxygenase